MEHEFLFRKGKCFSNHSGKTLPDGVIKALYMASLSRAFAHFFMRHFGNTLIECTKIRETKAVEIFGAQFMP